jgi:Zn-dependent peptidase ImmA (M78 family)
VMRTAPRRLADAARQSAPAIPVNIFKILRAHRIIVLHVKAGSEFNGLFVRLRSRPVIVLNATHPPARRRFTAAHELYHYLRHLDDPHTPAPSFHDSPDADGYSAVREEREANRFAARLLMPREAVVSAAEEGLDCEAMAKRFFVSLDAMRIRLRELRLEDVLERG